MVAHSLILHVEKEEASGGGAGPCSTRHGGARKSDHGKNGEACWPGGSRILSTPEGRERPAPGAGYHVAVARQGGVNFWELIYFLLGGDKEQHHRKDVSA